ncbi:MAG TPA: hypothetical protein VFL59_03255 [Candidatus Nanopelagicales bacterium]|nr:hypothetical protein [Candidatus Nanopelagicales bacterium]
MQQLTILLVVVVLVGAVAVYLSSLAGRIDRLHHRIETAHAGLDAQLLRRAAAAQDLASSGFLDPASALVLSSAAQETLVVSGDDDEERSLAESELTRSLAALLSDREDVEVIVEDAGPDAAVAEQLVTELAVACRRVELARRFHNDVVRSCVHVRRKRVARWFGLAGHTGMPQTIDFDDTVPAGLDGR